MEFREGDVWLRSPEYLGFSSFRFLPISIHNAGVGSSSLPVATIFFFPKPYFANANEPLESAHNNLGLHSKQSGHDSEQTGGAPLHFSGRYHSRARSSRPPIVKICATLSFNSGYLLSSPWAISSSAYERAESM